jgi:hypothetical protein
LSGDETFVTWASVALGALCAVWWYTRILRSPQADFASREFLALALAPLIALGGVYIVIVKAGSFDVRNAPAYIFMYSALGVVWFLGSAFLLEIVGISFRDDAIERRNPAAALVVVGAMFAHAAIYAGANIGNGPGWWTVVEAGLIGSGAWLALWAVVQFVCKISDDITIGRDLPAGIRMAGYALAMGLICARGAAGDWTSLDQTVREFFVAWPILPLTAVVIAIEKVLASRPHHYARGFAVSTIIAVVYLAVAVWAVAFAGPLPHNPQYDNVSPASS